jgi:hypothetical protein
MGSDRGRLGVPEDREWTGPSGDGPVHIVVPASPVPTLHRTGDIPDARTVLPAGRALHVITGIAPVTPKPLVVRAPGLRGWQVAE